jgi:hypothetical protein
MWMVFNNVFYLYYGCLMLGLLHQTVNARLKYLFTALHVYCHCIQNQTLIQYITLQVLIKMSCQ